MLSFYMFVYFFQVKDKTSSSQGWVRFVCFLVLIKLQKPTQRGRAAAPPLFSSQAGVGASRGGQRFASVLLCFGLFGFPFRSSSKHGPEGVWTALTAPSLGSLCNEVVSWIYPTLFAPSESPAVFCSGNSSTCWCSLSIGSDAPIHRSFSPPDPWYPHKQGTGG